MKVGDIVKHKHEPLMGSGIILGLKDLGPSRGWARIAWTAHNQTKVREMATHYLEVISESR